MTRALFWLGLMIILGVLMRHGRDRTAADLVGGVGVVSAGGMMLAATLASGLFGVLRLLADLLFLGLPAFLLVGGRLADWRPVRWTAWGLALMLAGIGLWSTQVEPRWLEVTHHRIESPQLEGPVRIVVVSDLQTDRWGAFEQRVVDEIVRQRPDVVLMTGDYVQVADRVKHEAVMASFRRALAESGLAPAGGIYAVGGDVEAAGWERDFDGTPVTALPAATSRFESMELAFTALDARTSRHARDPGRSPIRESERFHVAFGHAPDFALAHPPADLMLAGHVHGGQVRLPFFGPLITLSSVPRAWAVGRTDLDGGASAGGRTLIVSRGLGMERGQAPRLRFLCRPELVVIDLEPRE